MQTSIEEKLTEITIEQKLASLKEISKELESVDKMISALSDFSYAGIPSFTLHSHELDFKFEVPVFITPMCDLLEQHLKKRRVDLVTMAKKLMR